MTFTGYTRSVDRLGRIVVPKKMCAVIGIDEPDSKVKIFVEDEYIVFEKADTKHINSGDVRRLDSFGRIVIPIELRNYFDIKPQVDCLEIYLEKAQMKLKKVQPGCVLCNSSENLITFKGKKVCLNCIEELAKI